jgi:cell fate (sporulation/competence/biofilm development) regulator YmcA (YheA/YmcA/DUF963 family)
MDIENLIKVSAVIKEGVDLIIECVREQDKRIKELEKDLSELTITNDYQRVISEKNERISALEIELEEAKRRS